MSRKYKFRDNDKLYFISHAKVRRINVIIREKYNQVITDSWKHCQEKMRLEIYGWSRLRRDDKPFAYDYRKQKGQVGRYSLNIQKCTYLI
jgi:hypothetical protein